MREIVGYENNKAIYKDMGAARVHGASGVTETSKARNAKRTANLIERMERAKYPAAFLKAVIKNEKNDPNKETK